MGFDSSSEVNPPPSCCLEPWSFPGSTPDSCRAPFSSASLEVLIPTAFPVPRAAASCLAGFLHSRPPASSGSRNLLTPQSAPSLPALFHAGSALGITLQSLFPTAQPYAISSAAPLLVFHTPSGSCSTRQSATRSSYLGWRRARSSPGSFPLRGVHSLDAGPAFTGPPLVRLLFQTKAAEPAPLQGLARQEHG